LKNHGNRKEVREALSKGEGADVRKSETVGKDMYYYALLLNDGTVLRVSKSIDNLASTAVSLMPVMGILAVLTILFAFALARWQTNRLIKPINELDLERPLDSDIYEELSPLLEAMDRQNREKEAVANMRKEFSANVSHELKTPLTSISGFAEIMKNGMVPPADMGKFAEKIYNEAQRLIALVQDIIKLSKLDEKDTSLCEEEVELDALVQEACERLQPAAERKRVTLSAETEPILFRGVKQVLSEMIYNLCDNAIRYNKEGGAVFVTLKQKADRISLTVRDTGIGIAKEEQGRIFERFYRVDASRSAENGGTGLGLSIVKHGAALHNGKIFIESEIGNGTSIEISLPYSIN
ncbi:MAG TPA: two-component sensor histidine kinase, partial [Tyzzerella sp.]|nr:two-component sensor histidine kinase [Tyzzerella sp.]